MAFLEFLPPRLGANADEEEGLSLYSGNDWLLDDHPGYDDFSLKDIGWNMKRVFEDGEVGEVRFGWVMRVRSQVRK